MLQEMQKRGQLTIRINALLRPAIGASGVDPALAASGITQNEGDEMLRIGGIKLGVDGGFEGGLMREPYEKPWDENGTFRGLQTHRHRALHRRGPRVEPAGLARRHARGRRRRHRPGAERLRKGQRRAVDRRPPLVDRARVHRAARSAAAHEGARPRDLGAEPSLSRRAEPREVLGRGARGHHHAGEDVSRRAAAGVIGHRRAGRALSAAVDDLSLRHARHDHRRRARRRSEGHAPAGAAHGHHQQRVADDGRADQGIDRAGQVRGPRHPQRGSAHLSRDRGCATRKC